MTGLRWREPGVVHRLRAGIPAGLTAFGVSSAIAGLLFGTGTVANTSWEGGTAVLAVAVVTLLAAYLQGKQRAISQLVCEELGRESKYVCRPCSRENLREANKIVEPIFGRDSINPEILEQWRLRNPKGFMELINEKNELVGCFIVIGLEPSFMDQFKKGKVPEASITSDVVLSMSETKRLQEIYISGIMVRDSGGFLGSKRARVLIWSILEYLRKQFGLSRQRTLYALALTKDSESLLKTLNFSLHSQASERVDKHNLYRIEYTQDQWNDVLRRIGDLSSMCAISYKEDRT